MSISSSATGLRPGVCTSTTRPTSPYTGQIIYETDTGYLRVWDGSAWDYLSQSQDTTTNIKASDIGAAWTTFTPTWTAVTTNPAIGNGIMTGRYMKLNKFVIAEFVLQFGSTTTYGSGAWIFDLPVAAANGALSSFGYRVLGFGRSYDQSTANTYSIFPTFFASSTTVFRLISEGTGGTLNSTVPFTYTNGDEVLFVITYEGA